jgi:MFS transporter, DHA1 family, multidrug resistance protein
MNTAPPTATQTATLPSTRSTVLLVIILGSLTAFFPLCVDMYLPAFPAIVKNLATSADNVQLTLATFFAGAAIGQLFFGPLADRFGRKPPLYFGLAIFLLATLGCAVAPSIGWLITLRFFQAIGACAGGVISRAIIRDVFPPEDARWMFSNLMLVTGLAPILAPVFGTAILGWASWRYIFYVVAAVGFLCSIAVVFLLAESHDPANIAPIHPRAIVKSYLACLFERVFFINTFLSSLSLAGLFSYIAAAAFIFQEHFGLSPRAFSILFALNAASFVAAAQVNGRLLRRAEPTRVIRAAKIVQFVAGLLLIAVSLTGSASTLALVATVLPLAAMLCTIGFILPSSSALAMTPHGSRAGSASALMGTLQFTIAALAVFMMSKIGAHPALAMSITIATCAALGLIVNQFQVKKLEPALAA